MGVIRSPLTKWDDPPSNNTQSHRIHVTCINVGKYTIYGSRHGKMMAFQNCISGLKNSLNFGYLWVEFRGDAQLELLAQHVSNTMIKNRQNWLTWLPSFLLKFQGGVTTESFQDVNPAYDFLERIPRTAPQPLDPSQGESHPKERTWSHQEFHVPKMEVDFPLHRPYPYCVSIGEDSSILGAMLVMKSGWGISENVQLPIYIGIHLILVPLYCTCNTSLGGGFTYFLFSSLLGEDFHFDYIIFFKWVAWNHQLEAGG